MTWASICQAFGFVIFFEVETKFISPYNTSGKMLVTCLCILLASQHPCLRRRYRWAMKRNEMRRKVHIVCLFLLRKTFHFGVLSQIVVATSYLPVVSVQAGINDLNDIITQRNYLSTTWKNRQDRRMYSLIHWILRKFSCHSLSLIIPAL